MAKTTFLFVFFFLLKNINSVFAQNTWEKRYYDYENDAPLMYAEDTDLKFDSINAEFLFSGMSHGGLSSVYFIDSLGVLYFRSYYMGIGGSLKNSLFTRDGGGIVAGIESQGTYGVKTLYKTDSLNTIKWKYQYDIQVCGMRCGLMETSDIKYVLVGNACYNTYSIPFLIKTDSLGVAETVIYYAGLFASPRKIIETLDKNYVIAANDYLGEGVILFKIDTSGLAIWSKSYLRPNGFINDIIEKSNGNFILVGNTEVTVQTAIPKLFMMEVDSTGNTLWTNTYGDSINRFIFRPISFSYFRPIKIKPTIDGGYIIVASIMIGNSNHEDLVMLKTDSIGNIQWERRHGLSGQYEVGLQIIQTPDSGYFVAGVFNDDDPWIQKSGYYFLKTDSLGMVGCGENTDVILQTNLQSTDSNIVVTDSVLVINVYPAYVHDTTFAPADSLPGCIIDGVDMSSIEFKELSVYPNPSSGVVHLAMNTTEKKNIFAYDITGREVYRMQNTTESTLDIDLSENAKGIYLLRVTTAAWNAAVKVVLF